MEALMLQATRLWTLPRPRIQPSRGMALLHMVSRFGVADRFIGSVYMTLMPSGPASPPPERVFLWPKVRKAETICLE
jgi:hypothetical protein